ncbi:MAG TPA: 50S ribosomal protein L22 [Candidatus Atribacteria bacterium]|nr:50S ribosomal protein L22 [Candidatus Atribacteria bacterium]
MEVRAVARHVRISPRKARQAVNLIKGKSAQEALSVLNFIPKKSARLVKKVLQSAIANAENNWNLDVERLVVSRAYVDTGPTMKRVRPRAMGRADIIRKRTSHITVYVAEAEEGR